MVMGFHSGGFAVWRYFISHMISDGSVRTPGLGFKAPLEVYPEGRSPVRSGEVAAFGGLKGGAALPMKAIYR